MQRYILGLLVAALWCAAPVEATPLVEGRDFTQVNPAQPTTAKDKVEVIEFFSYQCPHCNAFSTPLNAWVKKLPRDVAFRRESISIGHQPWEPAARAFYALQALHKLESLDGQIFAAVHKQGIRFDDPAQITAWMGQHNVPAAEFRQAYDSFGVETSFRRGEALSRTFRVPSIPTVVIDGKYLVAIDSRIDYGVQLTNVTTLIERARAEKKLPSAHK